MQKTGCDNAFKLRVVDYAKKILTTALHRVSLGSARNSDWQKMKDKIADAPKSQKQLEMCP